MDLLSKLSQPFEKYAENDKNSQHLLFKLGEEIGVLESRKKQLYEKLGEDVYHQRQELVDAVKAEIYSVEQLLLEAEKKMEVLANEI